MLLDAGLDNRFWGEAILTAAYLQNRMTSHSIDKTPFELFLGEKPDLSHIKVFGSKVYSLIPKQRRRKWDDKAKEGVLIGYDGKTKAYRILNPETNQVWISRSVRIIERDEEQSGRHQTSQKEEASTSVNYEISELEEKDLASGEDEEPGSSGGDYETPSTTPELTQRRISQRTNKGVPPHRLMYKVQTGSIQEPES